MWRIKNLRLILYRQVLISRTFSNKVPAAGGWVSNGIAPMKTSLRSMSYGTVRPAILSGRSPALQDEGR
jgi:hypothetical protein